MGVCLTYAPADNTLRLDIAGSVAVRTLEIEGILDVAEKGHLIGVELSGSPGALRRWLADPGGAGLTTVAADGSAYMELSPPPIGAVRSVKVLLWTEFDRDDELVAIAIPRRGDGYEISYPSGNQ
jgi:hypothetical protein